MRDFARGQRCGSLISTIASVQECPDLTRAPNTTCVSLPAVTPVPFWIVMPGEQSEAEEACSLPAVKMKPCPLALKQIDGVFFFRSVSRGGDRISRNAVGRIHLCLTRWLVE